MCGKATENTTRSRAVGSELSLKRTGEMDDAEGVCVDLHHVEAGVGVGDAVLLQIPLGGTGEKELLLGGDGVPRETEGRIGAGLHFDKDEDA